MQLREAASPAPPWTRAHPAAVQKADPARRYPRRPCLHRFACFQNRSAVAVPGGQTAPEQTAAAQYSSVIVLIRLLEVQAAPVRQLHLHKPLHCGNLPGPDGFHPVCPLWFPGRSLGRSVSRSGPVSSGMRAFGRLTRKECRSRSMRRFSPRHQASLPHSSFSLPARRPVPPAGFVFRSPSGGRAL